MIFKPRTQFFTDVNTVFEANVIDMDDSTKILIFQGYLKENLEAILTTRKKKLREK